MNDMGMPPGTGATSAMQKTPPLWLLTLICFCGTLAMHIFVPVLPVAAIALAAGPGEMQLTIGVYILGLAIGQLFYGPLSDRYGRRPILMIGLVLYTTASLASLLSPSVDILIVARLFQALGGCAGLVISRAVVRDTSATTEAARRLALMNLAVLLGPGFAPIAGSALGEFAGWRSIFVLLTLLGLCGALFTWRLLPETARISRDQNAGLILQNYGRLLRTPAFLGFSIGGGCATTSFYGFISAAPFIFINQLGESAERIGIYLGIMTLGFWGGSLLTSRLAGRVPVRRMLVCANLLSLVAASALLGAATAGHLSVGLIVGLMFVFTTGAGVASPSALAEAISVNPLIIGSASGLYGFMQMAVGAICTALAGLGSDHAVAAATVVTVACLVSLACFLIANWASKTAG